MIDWLAERIRTRGENLATVPREPRLHNPSLYRASIPITDETALSLTVVYACITLLARVVASLPLHVYREGPDGIAQIEKAASTRYLWSRPNPEMTKYTYWETVIGHEVMGDAFLFVIKSRDDSPLELYYLEPWRVMTGRTSDGRKIYQVDRGSKEPQILLDFMAGGEIVHVPNFSRDSLRGLNPLRLAAPAIALGLSSQDYADRFFHEDAQPQAILHTAQTMTQEDADQLIDIYEQRNTGRRGTRLLTGGLEYQQVSISPEDAQLIEERRFTLGEIARLFGVPPHLVGDVERSTSWGSGIQEMARGFLSFTLSAHINRFEQAINDALLNREQTGRYVKFELGALLRPNEKERFDAFKAADFMTVNEKRALEDLPPVEGGDRLYVPLNMAPIDGGQSTAPAVEPTEEAIAAVVEAAGRIAEEVKANGRRNGNHS